MATWIGKRLRRVRIEQGLSQGVLAEKLKVSQTTISNWEQGRGKPDEAEIKKLERILGEFNKSIKSAKGGTAEKDVPYSEARPFADWLRTSREAAKLSVHELAEQSEVSPVQIYNLESGRSANPREVTKKRLEKALAVSVPEDVRAEVAEEQAIEGLGALTDFDPYDQVDRPTVPGVYVFYDVSERPVYVGKAKNIKTRVASHEDKFWFKFPIVNNAAFVEIKDDRLRHQVEQVLIKFLKSNAVINKQSVDRE